MKAIASALVALSVLAGVAGAAGSANALDAQKFWQEHATGGER